MTSFNQKVKKILLQIENNWSIYQIVILFYTLGILLSAFVVFGEVLFESFLVEPNNEIELAYSLQKRLIRTAFIVPIIETLIFQYFALNIYRYFFGEKGYLSVFITGILFGLSHYPYSGFSLISHTIIGFFLAYTYIIAWNRGKKPFWIVCLLHMLHNLTIVLLVHFIKNL